MENQSSIGRCAVGTVKGRPWLGGLASVAVSVPGSPQSIESGPLAPRNQAGSDGGTPHRDKGLCSPRWLKCASLRSTRPGEIRRKFSARDGPKSLTAPRGSSFYRNRVAAVKPLSASNPFLEAEVSSRNRTSCDSSATTAVVSIRFVECGRPKAASGSSPSLSSKAGLSQISNQERSPSNSPQTRALPAFTASVGSLPRPIILRSQQTRLGCIQKKHAADFVMHEKTETKNTRFPKPYSSSCLAQLDPSLGCGSPSRPHDLLLPHSKEALCEGTAHDKIVMEAAHTAGPGDLLNDPQTSFETAAHGCRNDSLKEGRVMKSSPSGLAKECNKFEAKTGIERNRRQQLPPNGPSEASEAVNWLDEAHGQEGTRKDIIRSGHLICEGNNVKVNGLQKLRENGDRSPDVCPGSLGVLRPKNSTEEHKQKQRVEEGNKNEEFVQQTLFRGSQSRLEVGQPCSLPEDLGSTMPMSPVGGSTDNFSHQFENAVESSRSNGASFDSLGSLNGLPSPPAHHCLTSIGLSAEASVRMNGSGSCHTMHTFPRAGSHPELGHGTRRGERVRGGIAPGPVLKQCLGRREERLGMASGKLSTRDKLEGLGSSFSEANIQQALSETDLELGSTDTLANGGKSEPGAARRLASRLYHLDGFRRGDVARHLGKNNEFSRQVAEEYLQFFDFTGMSVDKALRSFLRAFALMGETQERERVLAHFSHRFYQCNPGAIASEDGVHTLTCALMLLNTDLHGHNIGKRMSCQDFIGNLEGLNDGKDFPRDLLKALYSSIKNDKLEWTINEEELRRSLSELVDGGGGSSGRTANRLGNSSSNPFLDLVPNPTAEVHKVGFLTRKVHADADGRKTPKGRRGWKTFLAVLRGMVLYLHKREYKEGKELTDEELRNAISIHHSLASPATDYIKRPDVLRLVTADWRVFLFQAQNQDEMDSWIFRINLVAAIFSSPSFPAAVSSQKRFTRPLLPSIPTKLSLEQQMQSHDTKLVAVRSDLEACKSGATDKQSRSRENDEHRVRENYLLLEKTRYEAYVNLLTAKRRYGSDTEISRLEALVRGRTVDGALRKSHSSPSVNQAISPPRARVRRNMSERRAAKHSVRK